MKTENVEVQSKANIRRDDNNKQNQAKKSFMISNTWKY